MSENRPEDDAEGRWPYLAILLSPCLAAAVTFGMVAAAWQWRGRQPWWDIAAQVVAVVNAGLAACGAGLGGLYVRGRLVDRIGQAAVFGFTGLAIYVILLSCCGLNSPLFL